MDHSKLSVASYSFRNIIRENEQGMNVFADFLVENDIPNVEINNIFTTSHDFSKIVKIFTEKSIKPIQLTVDGNNFFQKKESQRQKQFDFMKPWIDAAHEANIPYLRANMGHGFGLFKKTDTLENIVATFRPILEYIEEAGLTFIFENHGGKSSNVDFQMAVKKEFPSPKMGFLMDCGNYRPKALVYDNILKLKDSILMVHAKTYGFDENGMETTVDYKKCVENLKKIGYDGYYSIEYEGALPDREGVLKTIQMLEKL